MERGDAKWGTLGRYKVTGDMEHDEAKYKTRTAEYRYEPAGPTVGHLQFFQKNKWQMPRGLYAWNWPNHNSYVYVIISEFR